MVTKPATGSRLFAVRGRESIGRQALSYVLLGLVGEGEVERIETESSPARALWQAR